MTVRRIIILAGVLLFVGAAVAVYCLFRFVPNLVDDLSRVLRISPAYEVPRVISVQALYPGANAQTVRDTVAAPIEEQVNGVEGLLSMSSQSADDGSYSLQVTFKAGTDLDMAQVLVQNRVSLALPVVPEIVQQEGISVRKKSPEPLVLVSLTSPDNRFDGIYLSNYATINVKDELARLPGVADVVLFGRSDNRILIVCDADKLAAHNLSALEVVTALSQQNIQVAGGPVGQDPEPKGGQFQLTINALGRLTEPEQLEGIVLKATPEGDIIRLNDVVHIEPGVNEGSEARLNGKPAVLLSIHSLPNAKPGNVSRAVHDKLAELRAKVPDGLDLAVAFDFTQNLEKPNNPATPEHLVVDAQLPEGASAERTARVLEQASGLLQKTPGVQDILTMTKHPFSPVRNRPCLVVRLVPKDQRNLGREQIAGEARVELQRQIPGAVFRLSVPSTSEGFPVYGFLVEFVVEDRGGYGDTALRDCAEALVDKMHRSGKFSDASVGPGLRNVPVLVMDVDRTKCLALGVEVKDVFSTIQIYLGSYHANNFNQFGRTWQITVQADSRFRARNSDLLMLQVKNNQNQLIRLGTVMNVRDTAGPLVIERHNLYPIGRITANLAEGTRIAEAKSLCESLAEQEFGTKQFKLIWRDR